MNKRLRFLFFILFVINSSCTRTSTNKQDKLNGFVINGTVTGYKDSTWIYLEDGSNKKLVKTDSALIKNGKFIFKGNLPLKAVEATLKIAKSEDYRFFWLENSMITFNATKGNFRNAVITGSETDLEDDKLKAIINPIEIAKHNLNQLSKKLNIVQTAALLKELDSLELKEAAITQTFIKNNPNSIVSVSNLSGYTSTWGKSVVAPLYANFSTENKNSLYGKDIAAYLKLNKDLKVGDHYADFSQQSSSGKMVKLSDYSGKIILLEFWGSWCIPCREGNPELVKTYNQFKEKGFEIVGVAADSEKSDWLKAIKQDKLLWPQVCDLKGDENDVVLMYGVNKFPSSFLIDKKGIIIAQDLRGKELQKRLATLLK